MKRPRLAPGQAHPFLDRATLDALQRLPKVRVRWKATHRLQLDVYPPVDYFERVAPPADRVVLNDLESLTDPAARQGIGQISLVPAARRVFGAGASGLMAPFTHVSGRNASRFTDGSYGVYYAGHHFETALREVAFHRARFHRSTKDEPTQTTYKVIVAKINKALHDLRTGSWPQLLDPDPARYTVPQRFGALLRDELSSDGVVYPSVRHAAGECVAAFWPDVMKFVSQDRRVALKWDGTTITSWFDYDDKKWSPLT